MDFEAYGPMPTDSPWGAVELAEEIRPGIVVVTTPSHGGALLSAERVRAMPPQYRIIGERSDYHPGTTAWEEDCEIAAVILSFPSEFPSDQDRARRQYDAMCRMAAKWRAR